MRRALSRIGDAVWKRIKREPKRKERAAKALADVPDDGELFDELREMFSNETGGMATEFLEVGAAQAEALGLGVDFELVNQDVLEYAGRFTNEWWAKLEETTRNGLRIAIMNHIESGDPLPALRKNLEPLFGRKRAEMIAATETTRLFAEGNRIAYRRAGVTQVEFRTCADNAVCVDCGSLDGQRYPIDMQEIVPPIHPRCRCWIAPVVDGSARTTPVEAPAPATPLTEAQYNSMSKKFVKGLTPDEKRAVLRYSGPDYDDINGYLRGRRTAEELFTFKNPKELTEVANTLDRAIAKGAIEEDIIVYRGFGKKAGEELVKKVGSTIRDEGFVSTTVDEAVARQFVQGGKGVLAEIRIPGGTRVAGLDGASAAPEELEMLLARGTEFRVVGTKMAPALRTPGGTFPEVRVVELEVVP